MRQEEERRRKRAFRRKRVLDSLLDVNESICKHIRTLRDYGWQISEEFELEIMVRSFADIEKCFGQLQGCISREAIYADDWKFKQCGFSARPLRERQCKGTKRDGRQCTTSAQPGSLFCRHHQDTELNTLENIISALGEEETP